MQYSGTLSFLFQVHPKSHFSIYNIYQGTITRVHNKLLSPLTTKNILIVDTVIIGIPLKYYFLLKGDIGPVLKQVHACFGTI